MLSIILIIYIHICFGFTSNKRDKNDALTMQEFMKGRTTDLPTDGVSEEVRYRDTA